MASIDDDPEWAYLMGDMTREEADAASASQASAQAPTTTTATTTTITTTTTTATAITTTAATTTQSSPAPGAPGEESSDQKSSDALFDEDPNFAIIMGTITQEEYDATMGAKAIMGSEAPPPQSVPVNWFKSDSFTFDLSSSSSRTITNAPPPRFPSQPSPALPYTANTFSFGLLPTPFLGNLPEPQPLAPLLPSQPQTSGAPPCTSETAQNPSVDIITDSVPQSPPTTEETVFLSNNFLQGPPATEEASPLPNNFLQNPPATEEVVPHPSSFLQDLPTAEALPLPDSFLQDPSATEEDLPLSSNFLQDLPNAEEIVPFPSNILQDASVTEEVLPLPSTFFQNPPTTEEALPLPHNFLQNPPVTEEVPPLPNNFLQDLPAAEEVVPLPSNFLQGPPATEEVLPLSGISVPPPPSPYPFRQPQSEPEPTVSSPTEVEPPIQTPTLQQGAEATSGLPFWITHPDPNGPVYDVSDIPLSQILALPYPPLSWKLNAVRNFQNRLANLRKRQIHLRNEANDKAKKIQRITENLENGLTKKGRPIGQGGGRRRRRVGGLTKNSRRGEMGSMIVKLGRLEMDNGPTEMDWEAEHTGRREDELSYRRRVGDIVTTVNGDVWVGGNVSGGGMDELKRGGGGDDKDFETL